MALRDVKAHAISKIKPMLKHIVPTGLRQSVKKSVLRKTELKIQNDDIVPFQPGAGSFGVNLIGPLSSSTGLGQSFRLIEQVFRDSEIPYSIYNYEINTYNTVDISGFADKLSADLPYSINLWHINPAEFVEAYAVFGKEAFDAKYNIAFWLWELEEFPDEWIRYLRVLDEVWTPSAFITDAIRKKTVKPVLTMPYHVTAECDTDRYDREYFGLPEDKFLFLMMYDTQSVSQRKNPDAVIESYKMAFPKEKEDIGLVIKINSADSRIMKELADKTAPYKNVYFIQDNLSKTAVNSLIADCDTYVSLHRAEGFGLVLAESMLLHVPTIATNWSANTEFMNPEVACMVDYQMVTLEKDYIPYKKGNCWADPDVEQAALYMRQLSDDPEKVQNLAQKAYAFIIDVLGMDRIKNKIENRLADINHA